MIDIGIDYMLGCVVAVIKCIIMIRRSMNKIEWNPRLTKCGQLLITINIKSLSPRVRTHRRNVHENKGLTK